MDNQRKLELGLLYWGSAILNKTKSEYLSGELDEEEESLLCSIETWLGEWKYYIDNYHTEDALKGV